MWCNQGASDDWDRCSLGRAVGHEKEGVWSVYLLSAVWWLCNVLEEKRCSSSFMSFVLFLPLYFLQVLSAHPLLAAAYIIMWPRSSSLLFIFRVVSINRLLPHLLCLSVHPVFISHLSVSPNLSSCCHPPVFNASPTCFLLDLLSGFLLPHFSCSHLLSMLQTPAFISFFLLYFSVWSFSL